MRKGEGETGLSVRDKKKVQRERERERERENESRDRKLHHMYLSYLSNVRTTFDFGIICRHSDIGHHLQERMDDLGRDRREWLTSQFTPIAREDPAPAPRTNASC